MDWLFARPIAHRGLHDIEAGVIENSRAAVEAAIAGGYGIEVDVQISADGVPVVFHDFHLDRLTAQTGRVQERAAADLLGIPLAGSAAGDCIWPLEELLALTAGRAPLVVEIKSDWTGDLDLADAAGRLLARYGNVAAKSFDPMVVARLRRIAPDLPRGLIGYGYRDREAHALPVVRRKALRNLAFLPLTRPSFLSWGLDDLDNRAMRLARRTFALPLMTWTVRSPADQARAALAGADQMVFEGFRP